ncbi:MAG: fumarate reductase subunit C [Burkholderiales bacterium]|nr:fumarate reductase subunit C [Burkholderiales bacterium]
MAEQVTRRPYRRAMTWEWITRHPRYLRYMVREFSCLFIGGWTLMMVWGLGRLAQGPEAWAAFLQALKSPASIVLHVLALAFSLYHSITWFRLTPKALPVQRGESFVADGVISGAHYALWALLSLAVLLLAGAF